MFGSPRQGPVNKRVSQRTQTQLAFGAAVILLVVSGVAAYATVVRLRIAERWVGHTRDVQSSLADLNNISARAGRARTRYVDTGDNAFFEEYQSAAADIPPKMQLIERLLADNPEQPDVAETADKRYQPPARPAEPVGPVEAQWVCAMRRSRRGCGRKLSTCQPRPTRCCRQCRTSEQLLLDYAPGAVATGCSASPHTSCALPSSSRWRLFFFHYRLLNAELNAREQAEASLRALSVRLLELQDQERRKFSRELHDSLGQYLVGVKMNLTMLGNSVPANALISECIKLLDQAMTETRTISHLLHPPLLDETGFASAARWYVEGFAKRSGIQTSLDMPEDLGRLPSSLELALFRVLQESLTNVHRHSKSRKADVSVTTVEQSGRAAGKRLRKGHSARTFSTAFVDKRAHGGVGLAGMRERIHELGGRLEMDSDSHGTQVVATLPRVERKSSAEELPPIDRRGVGHS